MGKKWKQRQTLFSWAPKSLQTMTAAMKLMLALWKKSYDKPRPHIEKQRHHIVNKYPYRQSYGFSSNHVWMWDLAIKKAEHQRTDTSPKFCSWRRLLRIPWTARRLNQSILKELTLNIHWKDWSWSWSSSILVRGWDGWMASLTRWT